MKDYTRSFPRLVSALVLTLTLLCSFAAAQSNSLSGSFGFLLSSYPVDPSGGGLALLGLMNFDGAGNVTGSYTARSNGGHPQSTGTFTGTYSSMPNGVGVKPGSVTLTLDIGITFSLDMVVTDGGQGLQLVATNCGGGCDPAGAVFSGVARAAYTGPVNGSYGFQFNSTPVPSAFLGAVSFDGAGNAAMSITNVGAPQEGSPPPVGSGTLQGTYSLNPDGSGTVTLTDPSGNPDQTFAIVSTDGGSGLLLVLASGPPQSTVSSGTARLQ
jgi:hypothetical protein